VKLNDTLEEVVTTVVLTNWVVLSLRETGTVLMATWTEGEAKVWVSPHVSVVVEEVMPVSANTRSMFNINRFNVLKKGQLLILTLNLTSEGPTGNKTSYPESGRALTLVTAGY